MTRKFFALTAAALIGLAGPAAAGSFAVEFPTLTYPPVATPDATRDCSDLTTVTDVTCPVAK